MRELTSIEAEHGVLGALMIKPDLCEVIGKSTVASVFGGVVPLTVLWPTAGVEPAVVNVQVTAFVFVASPFDTAPEATAIDTVLEFSSPEIVTRSAFPTTVTEAIVAFVAVTLAALATARVPGLVTGKSTAVSDVACVVPLIVL